MKKIFSFVLVLVLVCATFTGCKKKPERILYNVDLTEYVKLGNYKNIKIDKKSDEYQQMYDSMIRSDIESNGLYELKKEGKLQKGDIANIDFEGKKDGVAFEGGTSAGYELEIGSGTFIPGFEEGLIGKEIGSTVDLNLTFPESYHSADLAGQDVVFTVKINYVKSQEGKAPEDFYMSLGYTSVKAYYEKVEERTIEQLLQQAVLDKSEILSYPQEDLDFIYSKYYEQFENIIMQNGITVEDYYNQMGLDPVQFKEQMISEQVKPLMDMQMIWYAIFDKEKMELTQKDKDQAIKDIIAESGDNTLQKADIIENYGEYYVEMYAVSEKVFAFLEKNAKIS